MEGPVKKHMTKSEKLRRAAKVCWTIGMLMTANFLYQVVAGMTDSKVVAVAAALVAAAGVQYVITLMESALFDGTLPAPWAFEWREGGPLPWLWTGAALCLFVDVLLNLGGVSIFTANLERSNIGQTALGMDDAFVRFVSKLITVALAALFAVGSELLDEFASYTDIGQGRAQATRQGRAQEFADVLRSKARTQPMQEHRRNGKTAPAKATKTDTQFLRELVVEDDDDLSTGR
jgi:hypothetical protein